MIGPDGEIDTTIIIRESDGASIPNDSTNSDWRAYQDWLTRGGVVTPAASEPSAPTEVPLWAAQAALKQAGMYDAINAAIKPKEPAAPAPKPVQQTPAPVAPVKAGMSLLEMARLQMAAKASV